MPKRVSDADKVAAILAKFNIQTEEPIEIPETNYNHNNAVAMFGKVPEYFVLGVCRECKQEFAHNQPIPAGTRVGYCSDSCRKRAFERDTNVKWDRVISPRRGEPWDGDPPMIITPEQLRNLRKIAEWFTKNQTRLEIQSPTPEPLADLEDYSSPIDQEPVLPALDSDALVSVPESPRQEEAQTSPQSEPSRVALLQRYSVDDPFGSL